MASNYLKYNVDIVFCIDTTMSMYRILDKVKDRAINFYQDLITKMEQNRKHVDKVRARIVAFRDYIYDKEDAMMVTDFFELPAQAAEFAAVMKSMAPNGGGDDPEDALEAIAYAIRSDWNKGPDAQTRQVIVVWTDADAHELGYGKKSEFYPKGMPKSINELTAWWGSAVMPGPYMNERGKRLLLYAPDEKTWNLITNNWNNSTFFPSVAGDGLDEYTYDEILDAIVNSIVTQF